MLLPDGTYQRLRSENSEPARRSQQRFIELARKSAVAQPAPAEDSGEYAVAARGSQTQSGVSGVQPALLGKPSLPS
jgi:hypothetical protein